jgi:hypothetical protein
VMVVVYYDECVVHFDCEANNRNSFQMSKLSARRP